MTGKWISFEGGEGSGKTTLIKGLVEKLEEKKLPYLVTREPGGVPVAERIREILLEKTDHPMDPMTEAILFAASRRQHLVEKVLPALEEGKIVLMDRYIDSSVVYQGYARGLGMERIRALNQFATQGHLPLITFYLDIDPKMGLERIRQNQRSMNRLDYEDLLFHEKIREGYLLLCKKEERLHCINADKKPEELLEEVWTVFQEMVL